MSASTHTELQKTSEVSEVVKEAVQVTELLNASEQTHKSIWDARESCGIEHDHIHFLKKLYRDQKATVLIDEESDV